MVSEDKTEALKALAERLQACLKEKGWTQSELARRATLQAGQEVSRQNIWRYLNARNAPEPQVLMAMAQVLDVQPDWLLPAGHHRYDPPRPKVERYRVDAGTRPGFVRLRVDAEITAKDMTQIVAILEDEKYAQAG